MRGGPSAEAVGIFTLTPHSAPPSLHGDKGLLRYLGRLLDTDRAVSADALQPYYFRGHARVNIRTSSELRRAFDYFRHGVR
jgi:hypothetical protein